VDSNAPLISSILVTSTDSGMPQEQPRYRNCPEPDYPARAKIRGWSGTVKFDVLVQVDGRVGTLELAESSGYGVLDRAAQQAILKWVFHPAVRQGVKIASRVVVPLEFALK
jgi:protein TonB